MKTGSPITFVAGEALEAKRRVKLDVTSVTDPMEVIYADAGEDFIGVTEYAVAVGDEVAIRDRKEAGLHEVEIEVGTAIARGTVLYGAAAGRLCDTSSGTAQGSAAELATATGDVIQCYLD
ncbi:MAG: DUF2190 family protein [bacterium]|nr:DUF2190 family protein [bacterium]